MHKTLHLAIEFYHLTYHKKTKGTKVTKIIYQHPPQPPFVTLNTYGNSKYNPSKVGVGGVVSDNKGRWIKGFSIHTGISSNNIAEIQAVRYGLKMAQELGYKHINLEIDSQILLNWLTTYSVLAT